MVMLRLGPIVQCFEGCTPCLRSDSSVFLKGYILSLRVPCMPFGWVWSWMMLGTEVLMIVRGPPQDDRCDDGHDPQS